MKAKPAFSQLRRNADKPELPMLPSRGLYAITGPTANTGRLLAWADAVIEGGAVWLQYRDKGGDAVRRLEQALALRERCGSREVRFIVNDDVGLAAACSADGVHLGEDDGSIATARARLGAGAIIGVSCYDDIARAHALASEGADYLAFGAFFESGTKPGARRASVDVLQAAGSFGRPLVAIGGITPDNGRELVRAGADLLAVIGGLEGPPDHARTMARRYAALFHPPTTAIDE
jgi:thiamine-phosphate pyrophosphorylase